MTQGYSQKAARPKDKSKVSAKELQDNIKKETIELQSEHNKRMLNFKHWAKIIVFFIIIPLAVVLVFLSWFVSFLALNWHNPQVIMNKSGVFLSYIFTIIGSSAITHYIEKK